jgi:hypothetical protein
VVACQDAPPPLQERGGEGFATWFRLFVLGIRSGKSQKQGLQEQKQSKEKFLLLDQLLTNSCPKLLSKRQEAE